MKNKIALIFASYSGLAPECASATLMSAYHVGRETDWELVTFCQGRARTDYALNVCIAGMKKHEDECGERFTHVVYVDDDVILDGPNFIKLVTAVDPEHPVVFALAYHRQFPHNPALWTRTKDVYHRLIEYPENDYVQVEASGLCAAAWYRSAFDSMTEPYFEWDIRRWTPDVYLCKQLKDAGIPAFCHTGVKTIHLGIAPYVDQNLAEQFKDKWTHR